MDEPVEVAAMAPVLVEQFPDEELGDATRALGGQVGVFLVDGDDLLACGDPADARAGR